ncbi:MAG: hypothetical protein IPP08_03255 [Chlorobiota bacterium]|nr:MAG: hypothetical protein IPP08_03255 [Chlorobiota bacterium]
MRKKNILIPFLLVALFLLSSNFYQSYARSVTSNGPCPSGSECNEWIYTAVYATQVSGNGTTSEYLVCSMGVGCNGKSWNSCGILETPADTNSNRTERLKDTPELLKQFYNDIKKGLALTGEKFNSNYNKFEDHSNTIIVSPKINSIVELVNMKTGEVVHRSSMVKGNDVVELDKKNLENGVYAIVIRDKDNNMVGLDAVIK